MAKSVGPLNIGVSMNFGDVAGATRTAMATVGREAKASLAGMAGSFESEFARIGPKSTARIAAQQAATQQAAWAGSMRRVGPLADLGGVDYHYWSQQSVARDAAQKTAIRRANMMPWGMSTVSTMSREAAAAAAAGGGSDDGGDGSGGGRRFGIGGLRGLVPRPVAIALRTILRHPSLLPLAAGAMAYHAGHLAHDARVSGAGLGMSGAEYSSMDRSAFWAGSPMEAVGGGVRSMREVMAAAARGGVSNRAEAGLVGSLGIGGLSTTDALTRVGDAMQKVKDPAEALALAVRLFGENATATKRAIEEQQASGGRQWWEPNERENATNEGVFGGIKTAGSAAWGLAQKATAGAGLVMTGRSVFSQRLGQGLGSWWMGEGFGKGWSEGGQDGGYEDRQAARSAQQGAARRSADDIEAARLFKLKTSADQAIHGTLADPGQKLSMSLEEIRDQYKNKFLDRTQAARAAGLAVGDYEEAARPKAGLAGAYTTSSVQGYSQITEAMYARETAADVGKRTNALLEKYLPELVGAVREQRGFQTRPSEVN